MKTFLCLWLFTCLSFLTFISCKDEIKTESCPPKAALTLSEDSLLVELPYQQTIPIKGGNFSLRLEKVQGDYSADVCQIYTYPEVLVFVKLIQGKCEYILNPFQFGRCLPYGGSHSMVVPIYQGCKITDEIDGYTWVMAYDTMIFSRHSLLPYSKTREDSQKVLADPSVYTYKLWIKKRC